MEPNLRARIRAGDPDAFGLIFDEYARAVYSLGFRLTANWSAAEDVVSLTFLEAWRLRARIDPAGESLQPWLLGIAVNVCRSLARASRRHQAALARIPPPAVVPDFAEELAGRLDDTAQLHLVREALDALRDVRRRDLAELALLLPDPAGRELPAGRQQALKEHLMSEVRTTDRPPAGTPAARRRRKPGIVVAVAAAAAVAITLALLPRSTPGASPAATRLLAKIAAVAAAQPSPPCATTSSGISRAGCPIRPVEAVRAATAPWKSRTNGRSGSRFRTSA